MKKGVSPLIAFVITISLISVAVTLVLTTIKPTFDSISDTTVLDEGRRNLELMDSVIRQVASESEGSKRTVTLTVTDGNYRINATDDYIYYDYETKTDYTQEGIIKNVRLDKSPEFIDYFNHYIENDDASPPWTVKNGTWAVESGEYSGQNGIAYYHHGEVGQFAFEGRITNKSGTKAEIFVLPVAPENLMGYWTFDEGSDTETYDYSDYNNTGNLTNATGSCSGTGCPSWTSGKFDYGLEFDGIGDLVNITSLSDMGVTVAVWKKNTTDSDWYHLVNASGTLYVNGAPGSGQTIPVTNTSGTVIIGKNSSGGYFTGTIDEVQIFNSTLTANQIKSLYETSYKKLSSTSKSDTISQKTDVYLVLSDPVGETHFDEVKIKTNKREMRMSIPYINVDLNGTARFGKGNNQITIEHKGINTTTNEPIVEIMVT